MSPTPSVFLGEEVFKMFHLFPVLNKSFKREAVFRFGHRSVRFIYRYPLLVLLVFSVSKLEWKKNERGFTWGTWLYAAKDKLTKE